MPSLLSSLYILKITLLSDMELLKISSHSVGSRFVVILYVFHTDHFLILCVYLWLYNMCTCIWVWVHRCHGMHLEVRKQPWVLVPTFPIVWDGVSLLFTPEYVRLADQSSQGFSCSSNSQLQLWDHRCQPSLPAANGLWGFKLRSSSFWGQCFTHWTISPARCILCVCVCT